MYKIDSRKIKSGDTFICLPGGEPYIKQALENGAVKVIHLDRIGLAKLACESLEFPSNSLCVIGVTGTNGKTTVTQLVNAILNVYGCKSAVLGTLNADLTTPESIDIQQLMHDHLKAGGTHFVMEVSSHAIDQARILGICFDVKLLTNITQDHLDYHKTFENYKATKLKFLSENWDLGTRKTNAYKRNQALVIKPEDFENETIPTLNFLKGRFNQLNAKAATAILKACGLPESFISDQIQKATPPAGRFETLEEGQPFSVVVDYAHTPDGLENVLLEAQFMAQQHKGKLITVFGCGGNRDRGKRPQMAAIAHQFSDIVIVTQDNPRKEDPTQIITDILEGFPKRHTHQVVLDRKKAIQEAVSMAKAHDVVMIAGKGHETYQILGDETIHFDDREQARSAIKAWLKTHEIS